MKSDKEMKQFTNKGFYIGNDGDPSVGIPSFWHCLDGPFDFYDEEEKQEFLQSLQKTFELICDPACVISYEDREKQIQREEELLRELEGL